MLSWFQNLLRSIVSFFTRASKEAPLSKPDIQEPLPIPQDPPSEVLPIPTQDWQTRALGISTQFEGSDPWANITGNFDGAYLTCGALGWTFKWNNQQPLVKELVEAHGDHLLMTLMPKTGRDYLKAVLLPEKQGCEIVAKWSNGSEHVKEPYREELRALWKHPEMQKIQVQHASPMGSFAETQSIKFAKHYGFSTYPFNAYAMFFDQAVQNGTGNLIDFRETDGLRHETILNWCKNANGKTGSSDLNKNYKLWSEIFPNDESLVLFKLAYLKARISNSRYQYDVFNRRGTIIMGKGWVHGKLFSISG